MKKKKQFVSCNDCTFLVKNWEISRELSFIQHNNYLVGLFQEGTASSTLSSGGLICRRWLIFQASVVQRMDNTIHRINRYPVFKINVNKTNYAIQWIVIYPVGSVIHPLNNQAQTLTACNVKHTLIFQYDCPLIIVHGYSLELVLFHKHQ